MGNGLRAVDQYDGANGVCESTCAVATGCAPPGAGCDAPAIDCKQLVKGWNGNKCDTYSDGDTARCTDAGVCMVQGDLTVTICNAASSGVTALVSRSRIS